MILTGQPGYYPLSVETLQAGFVPASGGPSSQTIDLSGGTFGGEVFGEDIFGGSGLSGIPSAEAFPAPSLIVRWTGAPPSISTAEAFGSAPTIRMRIWPTSISSLQAFGTPGLRWLFRMAPLTIQSLESFPAVSVGNKLYHPPNARLSTAPVATGRIAAADAPEGRLSADVVPVGRLSKG